MTAPALSEAMIAEVSCLSAVWSAVQYWDETPPISRRPNRLFLPYFESAGHSCPAGAFVTVLPKIFTFSQPLKMNGGFFQPLFFVL